MEKKNIEWNEKKKCLSDNAKDLYAYLIKTALQKWNNLIKNVYWSVLRSTVKLKDIIDDNRKIFCWKVFLMK